MSQFLIILINLISKNYSALLGVVALSLKPHKGESGETSTPKRAYHFDRILISRGMTLVEVLVTLGISVAIMLAIATFEYNVITYPKNISGSFATAQDTQILLKTMIRELRATETGANGAYPLVTTSTSTLTFFVDYDNNEIVDRITYNMASSSIYRSVVAPTGSPLVYNDANAVTRMIVTNVRNDVANPLFQYFDTNYNGTSSPLTQPVTATAVRLVKINLKLDIDLNRTPTPVTYTVQTSLRNLKSNL